jgi:antitoxin VapB
VANCGWQMQKPSLGNGRGFLHLLYYEVYIKSIDMKTAKLFKNGQSQAVRLPKDFRFDGDEVFIKKVGSSVVLMPEKNSWDALVASVEHFTPEFMAQRDQPRTKDKRESWD